MGTWKSFDVKGEADEQVCKKIVDAAIAARTTLFDTSPMYGEAPRVLARSLGDRRYRAIIADKIWTASRREAREQISRSLAWYSGKIDIYQVHNLVSWEEHLPVIEDLRAKGKVDYTGATHYSTLALRELMRVMETRRVHVIQIPYNAANRAVEAEVLPLADELGVGVLIMQPLGAGALMKKQPTAAQLAPLQRFNVQTWSQALLKWILSDPRVHCVLPATRWPERATENAGAGNPPWFDGDTREYVARLATA